MPIICHILPRSVWERLPPGPLRAESLNTEGFIHCSYAEQIPWVANTFYAQADDLVVLCLDSGRVGSPVRDEDPGCGQKFPHVYGAIDLNAVVEVLPLLRDAAGQWTLPPKP